jgi:preprotein translocase subunit SecY
MKSLWMEFNAIVEKEDLQNHDLPRSNLITLGVGLSPINDASLIAELFGEVFPQLEVINWDEEVDEEDGEAENNVGTKWSLVWDMQQAFQRMLVRLHPEGVGRG